jgi:hypothetical protein
LVKFQPEKKLLKLWLVSGVILKFIFF